jgi:hypothetical protein
MKSLFALLMTFFFALSSSSTAFEHHGLGIGGTVFKTWGLGYRTQVDSNWGIVGNVGFLVLNDWSVFSVTPGLSYDIAKHNFSFQRFPKSYLRFYGVAYLAGIFENDRKYDASYINRGSHFDLGFGLGPGVELFLLANLSLHLEIPWMSFIRFSDKSPIFASSYPHIGGGVSYYF